MAKETGLDPSFLSKILTGKRSPPSDERTLRKLARILELDPIRLISSSGRIPSELQPLFEDPEFLKSLGGAPGFARPTQLEKRSKTRPKSPPSLRDAEDPAPAVFRPSSVLSEDLL